MTNIEWETPRELFNELDAEFEFTLDPCATSKNHKCKKYYTIEDNGLLQSWTGERVFMNPPYNDITSWVTKAANEVEFYDCPLVVGLLPAWTDRVWFHDYVYELSEIRFLQGRVKFLQNGQPQKSPIFGSMVVIWE